MLDIKQLLLPYHCAEDPMRMYDPGIMVSRNVQGWREQHPTACIDFLICGFACMDECSWNINGVK